MSRIFATGRAFIRELTGHGTSDSVLAFVHNQGLLTPAVALFVLGVVRGGFGYTTDPYVMASGYLFPGWPIAFVSDIVYGIGLVGLTWLLVFGSIAVLGALFATKPVNLTILGLGAYLSILFVPVFVIGMALALTIPAPELPPTATPQTGLFPPYDTGVDSYQQLRSTPQIGVVRTLKALGWGLIGFVLLPVLERSYGLDQMRTVMAVLPVTLLVIISTLLG